MLGLLRFILYIVGSVIILRFFARIIKSIINKTFELVGINKRISLRVFQILGIIFCIYCFHLFFSGVHYIDVEEGFPNLKISVIAGKLIIPDYEDLYIFNAK